MQVVDAWRALEYDFSIRYHVTWSDLEFYHCYGLHFLADKSKYMAALSFIFEGLY